jgi:hypothetical protein
MNDLLNWDIISRTFLNNNLKTKETILRLQQGLYYLHFSLNLKNKGFLTIKLLRQYRV